MRLRGSTQHARVSGLGALLGDSTTQAEACIANGMAQEIASDYASAYASYKQALSYLTPEYNAALAKATASKLPADYQTAQNIEAKIEDANTRLGRVADKIALSVNAYSALPKLNLIDTPEAIVSQSKLYKTLDILNRPFPTPLAPAPPDDLYTKDKYAYLRQALNTRNWDSVQKWYASELATKLTKTVNASQYWQISQLNLQDYCDRTFDRDDYAAFIRKCFVRFCVYDLGTYVGFGYGGSSDAQQTAFASRCSQNSPNFISGEPGVDHFTSFLDNPRLVGMNRWAAYDACVKGTRYAFEVCWLQEATKWNTFAIYSGIINAIGAAITGYGVGLLLAPAGAAAGGAAVGSSAASAGASTGVIAGTTAAGITTAGGIETVVVTGTAIGAGATAAGIAGATVGAGIAAGSILSTGAPAPISSPTIPSGDVTSITVTATPIAGGGAAGTVGAGVGAGAILSTVAPPALAEPDPIETVTVQGARPTTPELDAPVIYDSLSASALESLLNSPPPQVNVEDSNTANRIKSSLTDAVKSYGAKWVADHLAQLLAQQLGRQPTPEELGAWQNWLDAGMPGHSQNLYLALGVLGVVLAAAILAGKKKRRKGIKRKTR
jgi:hypothetical protein